MSRTSTLSCIFSGGAAITYFFRRAAEINPQHIGTPSATGLNLLAFGLACFAALAWEFGELFSDIFLGTNIQRNAPNTLRDLGLGVGGACLYVVVRYLSSRNAQPAARANASIASDF
jgi:hypothetical protein